MAILPYALAAILCLPSPGAEASLAGLPLARERLRQAALAAQVPFPLASPELRVQKRAHRMELWSGGRRVKVYAAGLSVNGLADKVRSGDHLTPEGRFHICTRSSQSAYHLFLGISYPNRAAAERGLRSKLIGRREYESIIRADQRNGCPPWDTGLGGTVGIHGHGASADWTWGCVALEDADVDEIWVACPLGTPILIEP